VRTSGNPTEFQSRVTMKALGVISSMTSFRLPTILRSLARDSSDACRVCRFCKDASALQKRGFSQLPR